MIVASFSACAKKGGGSDVNQPSAPKQSGDIGGEVGGGNDSIEPVIVTEPGGKIPGPTDQNPGQNNTKDQDNVQNDQDQDDIPGQESAELIERKKFASRYTGTADDALRDFLLYKMNSVKSEFQLRNIRSAQAVQSASLKMDLASPAKRVEMTIAIEAGKGKSQDVVFAGHIGADRTAHLTTNFRGNLAIATAKCLDKVVGNKATCETVHARIELGKKGQRSFVNVIFRRTNVKLAAQFAEKKCATQECEELYNVFAISQLNNQAVYNVDRDSARLKSAKLETFEVLNGRSGMKLSMITRGNELMNVSGELLRNSSSVSASTEVSYADQSASGKNYKTRLNDKIKDAAIVANNAKGQISVALTVGDERRNVSDKFEIQVERISKDIERLVEVLNP